MAPPDHQIDELFALFATYGDARYDEAVSLTDHCLQTAQHGIDAGAADEVVAAALLHDVGHFVLAERRGTENYLADDWDHDAVGERYVTELFGPSVGRIVGMHVEAKRYLCAVDTRYLAGLSPASTASLQVQGGPMTAAEVRDFEESEGWEDAVMVRRWDDLGKTSHAITGELISYRSLLKTLLPFDDRN